LDKWQGVPVFNEYRMIIGLKEVTWVK
jgi:hypothetical protein